MRSLALRNFVQYRANEAPDTRRHVHYCGGYFMQSILVSMMFFSLAGAISPGPVNLIASSLGARLGFIGALPHVAGASLSYCVVVWLMGSSLRLLLLTWPAVAQITQYVGAAYLLYLALRILKATVTSDTHTSQPLAGPARQWIQGVVQGGLVQSLNPKAWLVALSGVSLFVAGQQNADHMLIFFCAISGVVCFVSVAAWAAVGTLIRQWLAQPRYQRIFNQVLATLLVLTVYSMLAPA
jgi:threonine/homoserine/homoserine lactone efflux protein